MEVPYVRKLFTLYLPLSLVQGPDGGLSQSETCPYKDYAIFVLTDDLDFFFIETAIISKYSNNWLDFITEKESAYCAVRTEYVYKLGQFRHAIYNLPFPEGRADPACM